MTGTGFAYRTGRQKDKCPSFCQSSGVTAHSANTPPRWMDNADSHRLEENITRKGEEVARKGRKLLKSTGKKETTTNLRHLLLPLTKPTHHLTRPPCPASCMGEEHSFPTNTPGTTSSSGVFVTWQLLPPTADLCSTHPAITPSTPQHLMYVLLCCFPSTNPLCSLSELSCRVFLGSWCMV